MVTSFLITSGGFLVWYFGARLVLLESFNKGTLILFVETGTHEELMERRGLFFRMVMTQRETSVVMAPAAGVLVSH